MTFVSYAQNFEDVTLWRALKDVVDGFWIDVGAWDPDADSVTRAFSERGWRGINVEPLPDLQTKLRARRPNDINLAVAVGAAPGTAEFFEVPGTGLSTFDRPTARRHAAAGFPVEARTVEIMTLAAICEAHAPPDIHFLKLDCEGHEGAALAGMDFNRFRPWIVLAEATEPGRPRPNFAGWEPLLLAARYRFAWFDGLNRFYVAAERFDALASRVAAPPSVFDDFVRHIDLAQTTRPAAPATTPPAMLPLEQRIDLATHCRDCDPIPKVDGAGEVRLAADGTRVQVMHNGLLVQADGYCGEWMTRLIQRCHGHHEPQEERLFHAALSLLPPDATMIELGGNWSYYSAWFLQSAPGRRAVVLEPDPANAAVGHETMRLNGLHAEFVSGVAAAAAGEAAPFETERSGVLLLPRYSVPQLMALHGIERLDVLHCDTQGAELAVLTGCLDLLRAGRIGLLFVSTHATSITRDPLTHHRCLDLLRGCGAIIDGEHDPWESFSGDGLIVARFAAAPADWQAPPISIARHRETLFRDPCYDLVDALAAGDAAAGFADEVVRSLFERLLFRPIDPGGLARTVDYLRHGTVFDGWLMSLLRSPEFLSRRDRFAEDYWTETPGSAGLPAGNGAVRCSAMELTFQQETSLGAPGDRLLIPNDRLMLPAVAATGTWSPEQMEFLQERLAADRAYVLLDIGANVGLFSRQVLRGFPQVVAAHCVEPDPANYRALCHNLPRDGATVATYPVALGAVAGTITLFRDDENIGNNSVHADAMRDRRFTESRVPMAAAGAWMEANLVGDGPILWKSDTQGNDEEIIAATPWPIWRRVEVAIIELWRIQKPRDAVPAFLERVADMPHRRLGGVEVTVEAVAEYLESEDWTFEDLYLWR